MERKQGENCGPDSLKQLADFLRDPKAIKSVVDGLIDEGEFPQEMAASLFVREWTDSQLASAANTVLEIITPRYDGHLDHIVSREAEAVSNFCGPILQEEAERRHMDVRWFNKKG